jgi:hypothetical protein
VNTRSTCRFIIQHNYVPRLRFDIDGDARASFRFDARQAEHEAAGAVAHEFVGAVEQVDLGAAGARGMNGEVPQDLLAHVLGDVGVLSARERLSRARPALAAASLIFLHSPETMASIAARTFFEMRFGGPTSAGTGWSRAARARLAGMGGVMFSMVTTLACSAGRATR